MNSKKLVIVILAFSQVIRLLWGLPGNCRKRFCDQRLSGLVQVLKRFRLSVQINDSERRGSFDQTKQAVDPKLLHYVSTMPLDGPYRAPKQMGHFTVGFAADDQLQHSRLDTGQRVAHAGIGEDILLYD